MFNEVIIPEAVWREVVTSVADGISRLRQAGLWLSDDLVGLLLKEAGE